MKLSFLFRFGFTPLSCSDAMDTATEHRETISNAHSRRSSRIPLFDSLEPFALVALPVFAKMWCSASEFDQVKDMEGRKFSSQILRCTFQIT